MFKLLSRDDEVMAQSPTIEYLSLKAIENLMPNIKTVYQAYHGRNCVFICFSSGLFENKFKTFDMSNSV